MVPFAVISLIAFFYAGLAFAAGFFLDAAIAALVCVATFIGSVVALTVGQRRADQAVPPPHCGTRWDEAEL